MILFFASFMLLDTSIAAVRSPLFAGIFSFQFLDTDLHFSTFSIIVQGHAVFFTFLRISTIIIVRKIFLDFRNVCLKFNCFTYIRQLSILSPSLSISSSTVKTSTFTGGKSSSLPEVFLGKGVLKICSKFTWRTSMWTRDFNDSSPVNLLHIFRTSFYKSTYGGLLLL